MVHYIRYLRTPQIEDVSRKLFRVSAVAAVTTDLGDSYLAQDVTLVARLVDATKSGEILCSQEAHWSIDSRATKILLECSAKHVGRLVSLHITTRDTISAQVSDKAPAVVDIWSSTFHIKPKAKAERLIERRIKLQNASNARIWEETGDSIAKHIWDASFGCVVYLNSCFDNVTDNPLPTLRRLLTHDISKRLRVLEVGAGCGIVGIVLCQLRKCEVILTDLEDAQDIMQCNVGCATPASGSSVQRQVLEWGTGLGHLEDTRFDLVLVSDCIYNPDSSALLVDTLKYLAKDNPNILIFVAFKRRHDADDVFFENMRQNKLRIIEQYMIELPHCMTDYDIDQPRIETFVYGLVN